MSGYFTASVWVGGAGTLLHPHTDLGSVGPHPQDRLLGRPAVGGAALGLRKCRRPRLRAPPVFSSGLCSSSGILVFSVPCTVCLPRCKLPEGSSFSVCQTDSPASGSNALAPGGHVQRICELRSREGPVVTGRESEGMRGRREVASGHKLLAANKYAASAHCTARGIQPILHSNCEGTQPFRKLPCGSDGKASACNAGDPGSTPGSGRSPGEGRYVAHLQLL